MIHAEIWEKVKDDMAGGMTKATYEAVILPTFLYSVDLDSHTWTIGARTESGRAWLSERLRPRIFETLSSRLDHEELSLDLWYTERQDNN